MKVGESQLYIISVNIYCWVDSGECRW